MGVLRPVAISVMVIFASVLFTQGLGSEFGILSQVNDFTDNYPSEGECDWDEYGTLQNIQFNASGECKLTLQSYGVTVEDFNITRLLIDGQEEWNSQFTSKTNIDVENGEDGYITTAQNFEPVSTQETVQLLGQSFNEGNDNSGETTTVSISSDSELLILAIGHKDLPTITASYGGQSLSTLSQVNNVDQTTTVLYLTEPPTGTNDLTISLSGKKKWGAVVQRFDGVNTDNPFTQTSQDGGDISLSSTLSTTENDYPIDWTFSKAEQSVSAPNQTEIAEAVAEGQDKALRSSTSSSDDTATLSWNLGDNGVQLAANIDAGGDTVNRSEYISSEFSVDADADLYIDYRYNETSEPEEARLALWNGTSVVYETPLVEGLPSEDFLVEENVNLSQSGKYQFRVRWLNGEYNQQKLFSLEAEQRGDEISDATSGVYETSIQRGGTDDLVINRVSVLGEIPSDSVSGTIIWQGYRGQNLVISEKTQLRNGQLVRRGFGENERLTGYGYKVNLFSSQVNETPALESVAIEGSKTDSSVSRAISENFQVVIVMLFLGMALAYLASAISKS